MSKGKNETGILNKNMLVMNLYPQCNSTRSILTLLSNLVETQVQYKHNNVDLRCVEYNVIHLKNYIRHSHNLKRVLLQ